jgi:hypothetical protein
VILPQNFHDALHLIIGNLDREEAMFFLGEVLKPNTSWTWRELNELRERIMAIRLAS